MKTLWIMCGAPASGKSYFATHNLIKESGWAYISRDVIRASILEENEPYFSKEKEVFNIFIKEIVIALQKENIYNVIADATHLNWGSRGNLLVILKVIWVMIIKIFI